LADILISYSKADHTLALKLSTFLEAEGWSVWWDKSLGAADLYRDEIMKQLAAATGAAKADGKLIPVKTF
jgi:TIR domain-containing protein